MSRPLLRRLLTIALALPVMQLTTALLPAAAVPSARAALPPDVSVVLSTDSGPAGTRVDVQGTGWRTSWGQIQWEWSRRTIQVLNGFTADGGRFTTSFTVPPSADPGVYSLILAPAYRAALTFTVTPPGATSEVPQAFQPAQPKSDCTFFVETGHNLCAGFRQYWEQYGGLAVYGFPVSEELASDSGGTRQYFERAVFTWQPGSWPERFDVQLHLLGWAVVNGMDSAAEPAFQPSQPQDGCTFFPETGHNLCGGFRDYWQQYGGLAVYGFPISEEFVEIDLATREEYVVQYFERQRFEWRQGSWPARYDVSLSRLGMLTWGAWWRQVTWHPFSYGLFCATAPCVVR